MFKTDIIRLGSQPLRVGRHAGGSSGIPLLVFNGIGGNIELLAPLARSMSGRELLTFDVPGVDHSALPALPCRLRHIAALGAALLDRCGHGQAHVLGVSWGGGAALKFVRSHAARCRRLVRCATAPGAVMIPARLFRVAQDGDAAPPIGQYARAIAARLDGGHLVIDHGLLDVNRAGRGAVDGVHHRRRAVAGAPRAPGMRWIIVGTQSECVQANRSIVHRRTRDNVFAHDVCP